MGVEYELKFRANGQVLQQIDRETAGSRQVYHMETTYYDTPDGQLAKLHYTLRCRLENETAVCTLKTPAAGFGRREWELECGDIQTAIPELCKLMGSDLLLQLTQSGLQPICGARFTRTAKQLVLEDCTVELALDQGVLLGGGKELPLCEVEVELKQGSREGCAVYAVSLARQFALEPETKSKFARARELYENP